MSHLQEHLYAKLHNYIVAFDLRTSIVAFLVIVAVMVGVLWIIQRTLQRRDFLWALCFSAWLTVALMITLLARMPIAENTQNTVFSSFSELLNGHSGIWYDILFNVLLFVPCGWLLRMRIKPLPAFGTALLISLFIELVQLLTNRGLFELMDVLSNAVGGLIGILLFFLLSTIRNRIEK